MENELLDDDLILNEGENNFSKFNLRENNERAKWAMTLIWVVLGVELIALLSSYMQLDLLNAYANGEYVEDSAADANDLREQLIGIVYLALYITSAVTFIRWFRRAYYNLHTIESNLSYPESAAASTWFIPFLNLFRPFQIMRELYNRTNEIIKDKTDINLQQNSIGIWWFLWVVSGVFGQIIFRVSRDAETIDELTTMTQLSMVDSAITIPLAILAVKVIKDYNKAEKVLRPEL